MRILFHAPGLAAFRPAASLPHLLGVQPTAMSGLAGLSAAHKLTGNRGNIVHAEAPAKILRKDVARSAYGNVATLSKALGDRYRTRLARNFDMIIISMANFIRPTHDGSVLFDALRKLDGAVPFMVLGAGLQGRASLSDMMPGNANLIALFNERAKLFGVRGEQTAEWLNTNGFRNTTVLGCPSLYAYPQSVMGLDASGARLRAQAPRLMVAGHLNLRDNTLNPRGLNLVDVLGDSYASYVFQDEFLTYPELKDSPNLYNDGDARLSARLVNRYLSEKAGREVAFQNYYYFNEAGAWRQAARNYDAYVGDRFHCGVAALQGGIPAIFLKEDNRVGELTSFFDLPALSIKTFAEKGVAATLTDLLSEEALSKMKATYVRRFHDFRRTMRDHGLRVGVSLPNTGPDTGSEAD